MRQTMYIPAWQGFHFGDGSRGRNGREVPFPLSAPRRTYFYRARNAVYHLLKALTLKGDEVVLVPSYHHGNEVMAIRAAGASVRFYPIGRDLKPDLDALWDLSRDARVLFTIHYLGWPQPLAELRTLCRERGMILIEDCALALFSGSGERPLGSFGDHAIYCLYKTLPIPHGGLLVQNVEGLPELEDLDLVPASFTSTAARSAELILEGLRSRSNALGAAMVGLKRMAGTALSTMGVERLPVGETGFDVKSVDTGMSPWIHRLHRRYDHQEIRRKRRQNYLFLKEAFAGRVPLVFEELEEGVCPLFFPILVPDKHEAAERLKRRGVCCVEFWNRGDPEADRKAFPDTWFLRDHVLELPIHQDVRPSQLAYLAEEVLALGLPSDLEAARV